MSEFRRYRPGSYDDMVRSFRWEVPEHYNIGFDTVDKHDPAQLAMLWVYWSGT